MRRQAKQCNTPQVLVLVFRLPTWSVRHRVSSRPLKKSARIGRVLLKRPKVTCDAALDATLATERMWDHIVWQ